MGQLFDEYINHSKKLGKKHRTICIIEHAKKKVVEYLSYERKLLEINEKDSHRFLAWLLECHKANGAGIIVRNVKTCLNYGVKMGYLTTNPMSDIKVKAVPVAKYLNLKEIKALLEVGCDNRPQLASIIKIGLYTGMRAGEILGIRKSSIQKSCPTLNKPI